MRKITAILLSAILLIICSVFSSNAADKSTFQTEIVRGNPGETVEINLNLRNNPGITALSIDISYSEQDVELIGVEDGGLFEDSISTGSLNASPLKLSWYATDSQNKTASGTLATVKFKIRENAVSSRVIISYNPENVFDNTLQNQMFDVKHGWILFGDAKIGDTHPDNTVSIRDVTAIQRHIAELETLSGEQLVLADANGDNEINIADATHLQMFLAEYEVELG